MGKIDILFLTTQGLIDRLLHADNIITSPHVYTCIPPYIPPGPYNTF